MLQLASGLTIALLAAFSVATRATTLLPTGLPSSSTGVGRTPAPPVVDAGPWWECSIGHTLQQNGALVRCYQPGKVTDVVPACGVGHALVLNLSGNRDRCRNLSGGLLDYTCAIGYTAVILSGQDVCRHKAPDEYIPPIRPAGGLY